MSAARPLPGRNSLGARLALRVGLVSALLFALLTALSLGNEFGTARRAAHTESEGAIGLVRGPLALALWNLDQESLQLLLERLVATRLNVSARVMDPRGEVVASAMSDPPQVAEGLPITVTLLDPKGASVIGSLQVQQSEAVLRGQVKATAWRTAGFELAKLLAVVACIVFVLQTLVLRRLQSLATQVRQFRHDKPEFRLQDSAGDGVADEIGELVRAGNDSIRVQLELVNAQAARLQAEANDLAKSELLSRVGHELRTPLNTILGYTQLLRTEGDAAPAQRALASERIALAGWHLSALIDDLLQLSHLQAGQLPLTLQACDAVAVARDSLALVESDAATAGVVLNSLVLPAARLGVHADPLRLRQVLVNLLSNAVKYNHPQGQVTLRLQARADGAVDISVEDTGLGLSAAQLSQLFVPFNRLGREHTALPGSGLGLVIARALVRQMGGELRVESAEGRGSCFTVQLAGVDAAALPAAHTLAPAPLLQSPARVLYIEDDLVNAELLRALLALRPQLQAQAAATLAEALAVLQSGPLPDLVLLDLNLPDGSGEALLQTIRSEPTWSGVKVAVLSADTAQTTQARVLRDGADAFVPKPLDFARTLGVVDALLANPQGPSSPAPDSGPVGHVTGVARPDHCGLA